MGQFKEGDLIYTKVESKYVVFKILRVDEKWDTHHVLTYKPIKKIPKLADVPTLKVHTLHSSIVKFTKAKLIGNIPVTNEELTGFYVYLKLTDFERFAKETEQSVDDIVEEAQKIFKEANGLCDEKKFKEAVPLYERAFDLFPYFFECLDNLGLTYMDLDDWKQAIGCFNDSLSIEPNGIHALFSIGECYFKMGKIKEAVAQFKKTLKIHPKDELTIEWLEKSEKELK
jgi:tetratricopeptide (TPR) repeat protein